MSPTEQRAGRRRLQRAISVAVAALLVVVAFLVGLALGGPESGARLGAEAADHESGRGGHDHGTGEGAPEATEYVCPMHPQIRQDQPGTCPICYMDLVPVSSGGGGGSDGTLSMSEGAAALAHVRTSPVERVPLFREIDVFGRVTTADPGDAQITAWAAGRIERLYVETVGETVRRGSRLARIYSPEIVVAQETLLHALRDLGGEGHGEGHGVDSRTRAARAAADAARAELRLLGLSERQIEDIVEAGEASETVIIHAPASGTVMARHVAEGDYVQVGTPLLTLADLDEVWVQLEIYEEDLPAVRVGMPVELEFRGVSGDATEGTIAFVDPVVDPVRRVARARVELPNEDGHYRPDLFVDGTIRVEVLDERGRPPVSVPASAVLWTGRRSLVYVYDPVESPPIYMPIEIELGERVGDRFVIEAGVFPGERVVTNGAFRIDASLQIRGGATMMNPASDAPAAGGHDGH